MGGIVSAIGALVEAIVALFSSIIQLIFNIITWPFRFLARIIRKLAELIMRLARFIGGDHEPSGLAKLIGWIVTFALIALVLFGCAIIFNINVEGILYDLGVTNVPNIP